MFICEIKIVSAEQCKRWLERSWDYPKSWKGEISSSGLFVQMELSRTGQTWLDGICLFTGMTAGTREDWHMTSFILKTISARYHRVGGGGGM